MLRRTRGRGRGGILRRQQIMGSHANEKIGLSLKAENSTRFGKADAWKRRNSLAFNQRLEL